MPSLQHAAADAADKLSKLWICKECNNRFLCNPNQCFRPTDQRLVTMCVCVCAIAMRALEHDRLHTNLVSRPVVMFFKLLFEDFNNKMQLNGEAAPKHYFVWRKSHRCVKDHFSFGWPLSTIVTCVHSFCERKKKKKKPGTGSRHSTESKYKIIIQMQLKSTIDSKQIIIKFTIHWSKHNKHKQKLVSNSSPKLIFHFEKLSTSAVASNDCNVIHSDCLVQETLSCVVDECTSEQHPLIQKSFP